MIQATLTYVRRTKGLCRYEEVPSDSGPLVGVLYLAKSRLGEEPPQTITVTITGGKDATH